MYDKVMRVINFMHTCECKEDFDVIVVKNVNKWLRMKSLGKFGKYFKSQWLDSWFNKWQLYHRTIGLAATNCPIESYNGRINGDFTDRSYFNLVPAFEKLERLIEFESL